MKDRKGYFGMAHITGPLEHIEAGMEAVVDQGKVEPYEEGETLLQNAGRGLKAVKLLTRNEGEEAALRSFFEGLEGCTFTAERW